MKIFIVEGINRLSAANLLFTAGLKKEIDYTVIKDGLTNTYEIEVNERTVQVIGKMQMLSVL